MSAVIRSPDWRNLTPRLAATASGRIAKSCQRVQDVCEGVNQQSEIKRSHVVFSSFMSALIGAT